VNRPLMYPNAKSASSVRTIEPIKAEQSRLNEEMRSLRYMFVRPTKFEHRFIAAVVE
jgi:hypothetical protein